MPGSITFQHSTYSWPKFFCLLSIALIIQITFCESVAAQPADSTDTTRFPNTPPLSDLLQGNASFRMVLGRVALDPKRYRVGQFRFKKSDKPEDNPVDVLRTLTISLERGQPNLVLYRSTPSDRWMIEARGNGRCKIQYTQTQERYGLTWDQPASGLIKIELDQEGKKKHFTTMSLWHFRFEEPTVASQHVFPMLLKLEPNWNLELIAKETEERMEEVLQIKPQVTERQVQELMQEFSSNNASKRDRAHRELRTMGLAILTPLMMLDVNQLELEQRLRVERLIHAMKPTTDDTPNRLAAWLAGDYGVCQRVAAKLEGDAKKQGLAYLQGLSGIESSSIIR